MKKHRGIQKIKRNIFKLTPRGWEHLETGEIAKRSISLSSEDIQALKKLHLERKREKDLSRGRPKDGPI